MLERDSGLRSSLRFLTREGAYGLSRRRGDLPIHVAVEIATR
jgi:hypothetical protein